MAQYRVAIIACGGIARAHARGYQAVPDFKIVALADANQEAVDQFGRDFGVAENHRYLDYRAMLKAEQPDVVSVCSWHGQHAEMTIAAAASRPKLVICEKPMATNLQEADEMIVAAQRNKVKLAIGHMRRFYTGWEQARDLVASGAIGQPQRVSSLIHDGLLNWGTHTLDGMRFVLGDPAVEWVMGAVERQTDRYERGIRIEDRCLGLIHFAGNVDAVIESDLTDYGSINFQIIGSDGILNVDENQVRYFNATTNGWKTLDNAQNEPFAGQAQGLLDWLDGRVERYRGEAQQGRATLEALMAVYESVRRHEVVRMPLQTRLSPLDLLVENGALPVVYPGAYDIRSFLVRGEGMSWAR